MNQDESLIAHWRLDGDCRDETGRHHGTDHGVSFCPRDDGAGQAAVFDGIAGHLEVAPDSRLDLEGRAFTVSAWVKPESSLTNAPGNILQKFDPVNRCGLTLSLTSSAAGYSAHCDSRNVHFGIDDNITNDWVDCGRPWEGNPLIPCMVVYKGDLYVGTSDAVNPREACHVFQYAGGKGWVDCGRVGNDLRTYTVRSMIVHEGKLYAAVGKFWAGARCRTGEIPPTRIYCYDGDGNWMDAGEIEGGINIRCLASFQGEMYATTSVLNKRIYRCADGKTWEPCSGPLPGSGTCAMQVYRNALYAAGNGGTIFRYEGGNSWKCIGDRPYDVDQTHSLSVYQGRLYAGTWPYGQVIRYEADHEWSDCGRMGLGTTKPSPIDEIMDLTVYNGKLYGTAIPRAEVYRYDDDRRWTLLARFGTNPDFSEYQHPTWRRVTGMAVYAGRLFAGTGTCSCDDYLANDLNHDENAGRVFCMEAGHNVTYDDDIGTGWSHIAAVRAPNSLDLYLNGKKVSTRPVSVKQPCDVTNDRPLLIGFGEQNYFTGRMRDISLFAEPLSGEQIEQLAGEGG